MKENLNMYWLSEPVFMKNYEVQHYPSIEPLFVKTIN